MESFGAQSESDNMELGESDSSRVSCEVQQYNSDELQSVTDPDYGEETKIGFSILTTNKPQHEEDKGQTENEREHREQSRFKNKLHKNIADNRKTHNKYSSTSSSSASTEDDSESDSDENTAPANTENEQLLHTTTVERMKYDKQQNEDMPHSSDSEDDLVSTTNYNTINSLAALKDMLQSSGENSGSVDGFFHHYFLSHVNRLPSRNQTYSPYPLARRLSECREEDEYETEEGNTIIYMRLPVSFLCILAHSILQFFF